MELRSKYALVDAGSCTDAMCLAQFVWYFLRLD